jgi:poly(A) polymerase
VSENNRRDALEIISRLKRAGYKAYIVGGAVRDMVMGINPEDYDIATNASPSIVTQLFERAHPVGERFGVTLVIMRGKAYEVAQFRTEGKYLDGRRPETVAPSDEQEDVKRRDFTINALLYDPDKDGILDYVNGVEDIHKQVIRTVGDPKVRFAEDHLRMLRAVRFAARFGFRIEDKTFEAIREHAPHVSKISAERIGDELARMFSGYHPEKALDLLDSSGLLINLLPEVSALKGVEQPPEYHPEGDVYNHTRKMLDLFGGGTVTLAFGILFHDIGKPETYTYTDRVRFHEHDKIGAEKASAILKRLRFSREIVEKVNSLVLNHMRFIPVREMRPSTLRRFIAMDNFGELLELFRLDCLSSNCPMDLYDYIRTKYEEEKSRPEGPVLPKPLLSGNDLIELGFQKGPLFGEILRTLVDAQLEGRVSKRDEAVRFVLEKYKR